MDMWITIGESCVIAVEMLLLTYAKARKDLSQQIIGT